MNTPTSEQGPSLPGLDFTAVDFETANGFRGSPCAIGLVRVRDGQVVDTFYSLMRPPVGFDRFDPRNTAIHGLGPQDVQDSPRFAALFDQVHQFMGADTLVAHNMLFDLEVFEAALEVSGLDNPGLAGLCSVRLARAVYQLESHALPRAAAEAGFELKHHHHALWDARGAAAIVADIAQRSQQPDLLDLFASHSIAPEHLEPWTAPREHSSRATRQIRAFAHVFDSRVPGVSPEDMPDLMRWQDEGRNPIPDASADPGHRLYGQHVVFTGTLAMPRVDAKELAASYGAQTAARVSASTTILVVGDGYQPADLARSETTEPLRSRKAREALNRRATGQVLRVLSEDEFRGLVAEAWPSALQPLPR